MTTFRSSLILAMFVLAVGGCDVVQAVKQDDRICSTPAKTDFSNAMIAKTSIEQMLVTESCVHKWAYRLARAQGSNRELADATLGGCRDALLMEGNLIIREQTGKDADSASEAVMFRKLQERYGDKALFNVVQARAGHCDIP